ncbi:MAG: hypothetical protein HY868_19700 [Chloroflexi bacterium]|nr:hypothetical protein [Chloroflexota bacterium]
MSASRWRRGTLDNFWTNMRAPYPWHTKLWLLIRNNARKIATRQTCCGHAGEPGC